MFVNRGEEDMMFLRHHWFYLLGLLPVHGRVSRYVRVVLGYYDCKDRIVAWHRAELEKFDDGFRLQKASLRLVAARDRALDEGIGPLDPRYPKITDFYSVAARVEIKVANK